MTKSAKYIGLPYRVLTDVTLIPIAFTIKNGVTPSGGIIMMLPFAEIVPDHLQSTGRCTSPRVSCWPYAYPGVTL